MSTPVQSATPPRRAFDSLRSLKQRLGEGSLKQRLGEAPVTVLGWTAIVGVLVGAGLGWWAGWLEFRIIALVLAVALLVAVAYALGNSRYAASLELDNQRVRIGDQAYGRLVLHNPTDHAVASGRVGLPVGRALADFKVPRLTPDQTSEHLFQVKARRRSVIPIGPVRSVRTDPLGLLRRETQRAERIELFVHPEIVPLESAAIGFLRDIEGVATKNLSSSDVSFHALRDYIPGDDRRSIHWRTTARTGKLMVRQFEETMRAHLLLVLSLNPADYTGSDDFERAVSIAGSLGYAATREDREVTWFSGRTAHTFSTGMHLLDDLCRADLDPHAPTLKDLTAAASAACPASSVSAIITGANATSGDLRAAHLMIPPEVNTFAIRCGTGLAVTRRQIGTLPVLDLAQLSELPRVMRSVA